jgi:multiple sugar transport system ATP-binding protein
MAPRRYLVIANQLLVPNTDHGDLAARLARGVPSRPPPATPPATCSPPSTPSIAWANPKTQAKVGRTVDLAVDTGGFHFFDKTTGLAIGHPDTTTKGSRSTAARTV